MRKEKYGFLVLTLLFVLFLPHLTNAQTTHELVIAPPSAAGVYLNAQIMADSNANGTRKDSLRVYVLQRGGEYSVNAVLKNTGWVLRIKAQDGTGKKPIINLVNQATTTTPPGQFVTMAGNVYLSNLIISGIYEYDPASDPTGYSTALGTMQGALFNTTSAGKSLYIDSCQLTNTNGNHIRTDQAPVTVKVTNSLFTDMGNLRTSNLGAGKAIDLRAGSCDSLIMINNTFINWQDRIIRHYGSTAPIRYMNFDHNTLVNGMSYHGLMSLGKTNGKISITNNLFIDPFSLGADTDAIRQAEFESGEKDVNGLGRITWIFNVSADTLNPTFKISNNYYSLSTAGQKFLTDNGLKEGSPLTYKINSLLGADSATAFTKASISLTNIPPVMITFNTWYRSPTGGNKTKSTTNWNVQYDYNRRTIKYYRDTMSCVYATSSAAYTGGQKGYPVGDLNWFPAKKALWEKEVTAVEKLDNIIPEKYSLDQNYPNPFNPTTNINYNLPKNSSVTLKIFNALGQEVVTLVNGENQTAGKYQITWNGKDSFGKTMSTGIYFYELKSNNVNLVKKMLLMK
jgi:hypothetical protein